VCIASQKNPKALGGGLFFACFLGACAAAVLAFWVKRGVFLFAD